MIECIEGFDTCFCVSMDSNEAHDYDAAVRITDDQVYLKIVDDGLKSEALTKVGLVGVKVWICRGEKFGKQDLTPNFAKAKSKRRPPEKNRRQGGGRKRN